MILIKLVTTEQINDFFANSNDVSITESCKVVYIKDGETVKFINEEGSFVTLRSGQVDAKDLSFNKEEVKEVKKSFIEKKDKKK